MALLVPHVPVSVRQASEGGEGNRQNRGDLGGQQRRSHPHLVGSPDVSSRYRCGYGIGMYSWFTSGTNTSILYWYGNIPPKPFDMETSG